jgi:hypothetical protein
MFSPNHKFNQPKINWRSKMETQQVQQAGMTNEKPRMVKLGTLYRDFWGELLIRCRQEGVFMNTSARDQCWIGWAPVMLRTQYVFSFTEGRGEVAFELHFPNETRKLSAISQYVANSHRGKIHSLTCRKLKLEEKIGKTVDWTSWTAERRKPKVIVPITDGNIRDRQSWGQLMDDMMQSFLALKSAIESVLEPLDSESRYDWNSPDSHNNSIGRPVEDDA